MRLPRARLLYGALRLAERPARTANRPPLRPFDPGISVIIPERANPGVLAECLEKVSTACRELSEPSEILVIASGTAPAQYQPLHERYPQVRWFFSRAPLWYSGAIRRGLAAARHDWVYLLNSDMLLDAQALESLLPWRAPRVFSIASQVFFRDPARRR